VGQGRPIAEIEKNGCGLPARRPMIGPRSPVRDPDIVALMLVATATVSSMAQDPVDSAATLMVRMTIQLHLAGLGVPG